MAKRAFILCNGEPVSRALCRWLAHESDIVIAADGGANVARGYAIVPDVIIGDLDSITPITKRVFRSSIMIPVPRQDKTDLEKALDFAKRGKFSTVIVAGAIGRRLDFTLGNLSVVWRYVRSLDVSFAGDGWVALPVQGTRRVAARRGTTVSIIPFGPCSGVTLRGLKYLLAGARMRVGEIGVSNVVRRSPFSVSVKKGKLLLIILDDLSRVRV